MNFKTTFILTAVAVAMFGYIWFYERRQPTRSEENVLLTGYDPRTIQAIEISGTNGLVRIEREDAEWRMTEPIEYPANESAVDYFLSRIESLPRLQLQVGEAQDLSPFGLDSPRVSLTLRSPDTRFVLRFGGATVNRDQVYVSLADQPGVFLAGYEFYKLATLPADQWRDLTFLSLGEIDYDGLRVTAAGQAFTVQYDAANQLWRMTQPLPDRADTEKLNLLLDQLNQVQVARFTPETVATNQTATGLTDPSLSIAFLNQTNELFQVTFGRSPTNFPNLIYARQSRKTNVVEVPREVVERFRKPYTEFRDRRLLSFDPKRVDEVEVKAEEDFRLVRESQKDWKIVSSREIPADPGLVEEFLDRLSRLEIRHFDKDVVTDFGPFGLDVPEWEYILRAKKEDPDSLREIARVQFGTNDLERVFTRRNNENAVVSTSYSDSLELPREAFELRDRRIWNFSTNAVTGITVYRGDENFKLRRGKDEEWELAPPSTGNVNPFGIEESLHRLGRLRAVDWKGKGKSWERVFGIQNAHRGVSLQLKEGESSREASVFFGKRYPNGDVYASVVLDGETLVFFFPKDVFEMVELYLLGIETKPQSP